MIKTNLLKGSPKEKKNRKQERIRGCSMYDMSKTISEFNDPYKTIQHIFSPFPTMIFRHFLVHKSYHLCLS